ncbi:MAG TPA: hypothetical protein VM600_04485 [Actinomycetota bacterium]|nr:hypothetical protein [Actinomycetota bacterium]
MPSLVFLSIATALGLVIALLPRTGNQPPPPTVAEFAPQAAREIRKSQPDQSSNSGDGAGRCEEGQDCSSPEDKEEEPPVIEVPQVKQCFGDPPRQTEDPQSPPCMPYFKGENSGASWQGVTANEIVVALPQVAFEDPAEIRRLVDSHFNKRYQMYGRKIRIVTFPARGNLNARPDPQQELADAKDVDEKLQAFASLSTGGRYGAEHLYYDELARRQIISIAHRAGAKTEETYLRRFAPYRWSVLPGIDTMQRHVGEFACNMLKGRPAEHAGPGSNADPRVFGLIYERSSDGTIPNLDALRGQMSSCGAPFAVDEEYFEGGDANRSATNIMLKLRQGNVSTVMCFCDNSDVRGSLMQAASAEQYRPEWVLTTYIDNDVDNSFSTAPADQATNVMGVTFRNKLLPRQDMPWYWAYKEDPENPEPPALNGNPLGARYSSLLLLASGIQMAGPNLTPETFEQGLFRARFPNPGAGAAPYYQARVGFEGGRHTMIADAALYWFDPAERGTVDPNSVGAICYGFQGRRFTLGGWPKVEPPVFGRCRP